VPVTQFGRRAFLQLAACSGMAAVLPARLGGAPALAATPATAPPGGALDPTTVAKYVSRLVRPPGLPPANPARGIDRYVVAASQFRQQVLPAPLPSTRVWGYGVWGYGARGYGAQPVPGTAGYPGFTFEATAGRPVQVTWVNGLVHRGGRFRPH